VNFAIYHCFFKLSAQPLSLAVSKTTFSRCGKRHFFILQGPQNQNTVLLVVLTLSTDVVSLTATYKQLALLAVVADAVVNKPAAS
jgi:hypothetical protein